MIQIETQIKNDLLLRALTAYLRLIQARESVRYAEESVENIKKQTELEDAAVSAGGGLTSDVLQAKTQLAGAQARLFQFEGVLSSSQHEFRYVFGLLPKDLNSLLVRMSGSGATCFGIFNSQLDLDNAYNKIIEIRKNWWIKKGKILNNTKYVN